MNESKKNNIEEQILHATEGKVIDLRDEKLSISDFEWLTDIIKKSIYLETILLPDISIHDAEVILVMLERATIKNSTLTNINLNIAESTIQTDKSIAEPYKKIQSRLQRNRGHIFGIHGGGSIGLGLMADIISKSPFTYHAVATSNNQLNCSLVNSSNRLWLKHNLSNREEITCVNNVTIIPRESRNIARLYTESCFVAICLTPTMIPNVAKDIAHGLIKRFEIDGSGLKILILMNLPNAANFVSEKVAHEIRLIIHDTSLADKILSNIEFIPTVIDRIVTPIPEQIIKSQLKSQLEKIDPVQLSSKLNTDNIESIVEDTDTLIKAASIFQLQFNLFNAEKHFTMHVANNFIEANKFPLMTKTKNLNTLEAIKNKYINGPHAILAWLGALLGYSTISESINQPKLFYFIKEMMEKEITPILTAEYQDLTKEDLSQLKESFFERCITIIDDPVIRVGRDPMRKLDSGGRIRGTIELAQKHNLAISTPRLEQGIAAGFLYALKEIDPTNPGCQKIMEIYKTNNKSFRSILCYSGTAPSGNFSGLHPEKDSSLINNISQKMSTFDRWKENLQHPNKSSTALVSSRINSINRAKLIPKTLFTASDYFISYLLSKPTIRKNAISSDKITTKSITKMMKKYYTTSSMWRTPKLLESTRQNTKAISNSNSMMLK